MEISKYLRDYSRTIMGKQQLIIGALAKALEIIPRQICDNAGFDATDVLNKLRMQHAKGDVWAGVDVETEGVSDNFKNFVWEPALVKTNALSSAVEAATLILSVDETVRNPQSDQVCPTESTLCGSLIMLCLVERRYGTQDATGCRWQGAARSWTGTRTRTLGWQLYVLLHWICRSRSNAYIDTVTFRPLTSFGPLQYIMSQLSLHGAERFLVMRPSDDQICCRTCHAAPFPLYLALYCFTFSLSSSLYFSSNSSAAALQSMGSLFAFLKYDVFAIIALNTIKTVQELKLSIYAVSRTAVGCSFVRKQKGRPEGLSSCGLIKKGSAERSWRFPCGRFASYVSARGLGSKDHSAILGFRSHV